MRAFGMFIAPPMLSKKKYWIRPLSAGYGAIVALCLTSATTFPLFSVAKAQTPTTVDEARRLERVNVHIENPSPDAALNSRIIDRVRKGLGFFPGDTFFRGVAEFNLARARRASPITRTVLELEPGLSGGVVATIVITFGPKATIEEGRGALISGKVSDLPVLYDRNGVYLRLRLESIGMYYGNQNAWYGQPRSLLAGNPLVKGRTAGRGYSQWAEGFLHGGLYGMVPLTGNVSLYGGISGIYSGSAGQELFTNRTRGYFGIEDAFAGVVGGETSADGDRFVFSASYGRQRFSVGDGFMIANTASNGGTRGALQSNPRWAADRLALVQARFNNTKVEAFYLDPNELPIVDSRTKIAGLNIETRVSGGLELGGMFLRVMNSDFKYFTTASTLSREGLQVYNARIRWQPNLAGAGLFIAAEAALQRNENFSMRATGWTAEIGYAFADALPWSPTISYRYASFSGDNPSTTRFERWDPLLSGDNGERWVQGINHFKVFQNSNISTHRLQLRLKPDPKLEIVPQLWLFTANSTTNIGGNPAFSVLKGTFLGAEANVSAKWFVSPQVMVQGHVAMTLPSSAASKTVGNDLNRWISTMAFIRVGL